MMARPWWQQPLRVYQPNLRLIDGGQIPSDLVDQAQDLSANAMVVNAGGAFAFYPTKLDCQERAPSLIGDLFGGIVEKGRSKGIRVIGRLEVSVKSKEIYDRHPEWFYVDAEGKPLDARGYFSTCINGPGFRDQLRAIIRELMDLYLPDGVFFNGYGYRDSDASGYRGPCQCAGCLEAFRTFCGKAVPSKEGWQDRSNPTREDYAKFKVKTTAAFLKDIKGFIREQNPEAVVFHGLSYTPRTDAPGHSPGETLAEVGDAPDIIRCEYQQMPYHNPATWSYWVGEQGKVGMGLRRRTDIVLDYPISSHYRQGCHAGDWVGLVMARTLAGGSVPHLHFIGPAGVQEDRQGMEVSKALMGFARTHESIYDEAQQVSPAGLFLSHTTARSDRDGRYLYAYRGWYRALSRGHVPFDVVPGAGFGIDNLASALASYKTLILPNVERLTEEEKEAVDQYVEAGGALVASLRTSLVDEGGDRLTRFGLRCMAGMVPVGHRQAHMNAYCRVGVNRLPGFPDTIDLLPVHGDVVCVRAIEGSKPRFTMTAPEPNCIPEDAFIRTETDWPGLVLGDFGKGRVAYLPWAPDRMYHQARQPGLEAFLLGVVEVVSPYTRRFLETDAPPSVEVALFQQPGRLILHLVNASGCWDGHFDAPITLRNLQFSIEGRYGAIQALGQNAELGAEYDGERTRWTLPELGLYEAVVLTV
jgi:hypothetical protein